MSDTDSELRDHLAAPAADWVAEHAEAGGEHPGVEALIAYHGGTLPEDAARRVQDHLVVCRECLSALLELDGFSRPLEDEMLAQSDDFSDAAAWRTLRGRLPAERTPGAAPSGRNYAPGPRLPRWAMALAAGLAVAVIGLASWGLGQRSRLAELDRRLVELSRPQPGAAVRDLFPSSAVRGEEGGPPVVELPAGVFTLLLLNLPEGPAYPAYEIEIVDAAGRRLWSGEDLALSGFGTLRLGLPAGFLPPGEHSLRLYGVDGEESTWVETYPLRVPGS